MFCAHFFDFPWLNWIELPVWGPTSVLPFSFCHTLGTSVHFDFGQMALWNAAQTSYVSVSSIVGHPSMDLQVCVCHGSIPL